MREQKRFYTLNTKQTENRLKTQDRKIPDQHHDTMEMYHLKMQD